MPGIDIDKLLTLFHSQKLTSSELNHTHQRAKIVLEHFLNKR